MTRQMTDKKTADTWDLEIRPYRTPYFAYGAALIIFLAHVAVGVLLKVGSTGVVFQTSDQVAIALLGAIIGGVVLMFARPRLKVGPAGVAVRNLVSFPWSEVLGITFPVGARWARLDLPDDEYIAVMAIQAIDKGRAVAAMDEVRVLIDRYRSDLG